MKVPHEEVAPHAHEVRPPQVYAIAPDSVTWEHRPPETDVFALGTVPFVYNAMGLQGLRD